LRETFALLKIDFLAKARADVPARVTDQRPAHRRGALAVVVKVLFSHVGVVPGDLLLEPVRFRVVVDLDDLRSDDSFQPVKDGACPYAVDRALPFGPVPQTDGIMVPVGVPEPNIRRLAVSGPSVSMSSLRNRPIAAALRMTTRCSCRRITPRSGRKSKSSARSRCSSSILSNGGCLTFTSRNSTANSSEAERQAGVEPGGTEGAKVLVFRD
jgi:hypothetical protein